MATPSSKSLPQQTHFKDVHHIPPPLRLTTTNSKNKSKKSRKKKSLLHPQKITHLGKKLGQLMKIFTPISFKPLNLSSLSPPHQHLLKRAGLWDFLHLKFDPELRSDLIAELIVSYNPQAAPHRRCFVNGTTVMLTRAELGRALELPLRRKGAAKEGERFCGYEVVSDEEVLFLENVVLKYVVLCGGEDGMGDDVLEIIRVIKDERRPEQVDWRELLWVMVEKELRKGVELMECYYASHLQLFLRRHRPTLFGVRGGKLGFDDLGVREFELGVSRVDEKESEKKVKVLVGYQRRKGNSSKMVSSEGEDLKGEKGSGSIFGHAKGANMEKLEVGNFGGNPSESVVGGLSEEGGDSVGRKSGVCVDSVEKVINEGLMGLENVEGEVKLMRDVKEDDSKVDPSVDGGCMVDMKISGSDDAYTIVIGNKESESLVQNSEQDNVADVKISGADLITEHRENNMVGGQRSGVNSGKFDDQPLIELEKEKDGLSSIQDENVYVVEGECLLKDNEDRGGEERNDNMCLITGEGKEDGSKMDFLVKDGNTKMGSYYDSVADVTMEGSYDDAVNQMENDDQLKLDVMVEDKGLISVESTVEQEFKEVQLECDSICLTQGKSDNMDLEIGKESDVQMLVVSEKEVEDRSLGLCLLQGEMKMEGPLEGGEDIKMSSADDDNGKQMEIRHMKISLEHGNYFLENQGARKVDPSVAGGCMIDLKISGSDDAYMIDIGNEESESLVQNTELGNVADVKISGVELITEQGDNIVGEERSGVNGGKFDDQPLLETENGNIDLEIGEGSNVQMQVVSKREVEDRSFDLCLLHGEMKMEGPLKEGEDIKMSTSDDDNGMQIEIGQITTSLEHGNCVLENQENSMLSRQGEKAEVIVQEDFVKQDGIGVDVEMRSFGSSSGNNFIEVVKEENVVDFEDNEAKLKKKEHFKHCSPSMDAEYESQSEKAVEVREEDMEDHDKESPFKDCNLSIDTVSDSVSEKAVGISEEDTVSNSVSDKAVEISEEDSPHGTANDCSVVEPFVSGTSMMDQDFFGNASNRKDSCENYDYVEPFVLEHNMRGSSVFENSLKTEIDLMNDAHKRHRTEGLSEKIPMPLRRKMNHTNDGHVITRSGGQSHKDLDDLGSWGEQVDFWLAQTKKTVAAKEDAWLSAQREEQMLSKKLEQQDRTIRLLEKTKHEELQKRNSKINCLENELFFMANQIDHYKKALATTRQSFAAFRERCKLPEEPLYVDIPGNGGIVLSINEWEKEQLRREQEERNNRLDTMITTFQLHWIDQFEGHKKRIKLTSDRLSVVESDVKDLKTTFKNAIFGE